jgi:uncharacterized membrane protein
LEAFSDGVIAVAATLLVLDIEAPALRPHESLAAELSIERRRAILTRSFAGVLPYVVAMAVAPVSPYATLAVCAAIAVYYILPASRDDAAPSAPPPD